MIPHLMGLLAGGDNARILPLSALSGAVFLVWADTVARIVMAPEDIPIGIVTGLGGGLADGAARLTALSAALRQQAVGLRDL